MWRFFASYAVTNVVAIPVSSGVPASSSCWMEWFLSYVRDYLVVFDALRLKRVAGCGYCYCCW